MNKEKDKLRNYNSHSQAVARYNQKNYKTLSVRMRHEEFNRLSNVAEQYGVSCPRVLVDVFNNLDESTLAQIMSNHGKD